MSDIKTLLTEQLADIQWNDLKPHAGRDALIIVANSLNIVQVAEAIALDNVPLVQEWMSQQLIYKPSPQQLMIWNENPQQEFSALIVQPFVLARPVIKFEV